MSRIQRKEFKRYTDNQIKWLKEYTQAEMNSVRQAVAEAKSTYTSDKASSNEFRGQLKDQANTFVTRRELWSAVAIVIAIVLGLLSYIK